MRPLRPPLAYLLTFVPYGTWLPGDHRGSHRRGAAKPFPVDLAREEGAAACLRYPVVTLSLERRDLVRAAITATCAHRGWALHALVVEREHVHAVLTAPVAPERVLADLKAWATRGLRAAGHLVDHPRPWASHGSTRYLFHQDSVALAVGYVLDEHHPDARRG